MKYLTILVVLLISTLPVATAYTTYVPNTVSIEAQNYLKTLTHDPNTDPNPPAITDVNGWKTYCQNYQAMFTSSSNTIINIYKPTITQKTIAGVPVYEVLPKNYIDNGKVIVYIHGGVVVGSAASTLGSATLLANATGWKVINVEFANCLNGKWQKVTDQVISVVNALDNVTMIGLSAGGIVGGGAILKGNLDIDKLVLISTWLDLTESGDTYNTLKSEDPITSYEKHLKIPAQIYAGSTNMKDPFVSPVYGNVSNFPPTLIQGGTKDIFMSGWLRMYQNLDNSGVDVKLDLYEGMVHSFQTRAYTLPESKLAMQKMVEFIRD